MSTIKKRKGFSLVVTIFIFLLIGAVLVGTVMLLDTNDTEVTSNNQQLQAREICIAGLDVMFDHMTTTPSDYTYALSNDPSNINFSMNVNVPFYVYSQNNKNDYLNSSNQATDAIVTINVVEDSDLETEGMLIATAQTDYALTNTKVKLEIKYTFKNGTYEFQKGRFIN